MKSDVHDTTLREVERRGGKGRRARAMHMCICTCMQASMLISVHVSMCMGVCFGVCKSLRS